MFSNLHNYRISRFFFFFCTKWRNSDFTPSHALMTQFFWTPHAVPRNAKNFWKIGGVYADLIHAQGAFRVQNLNYAATTTPHRSRLQSYDIHIFIIVLKHLSTCIVESVVSYHGDDYINRTRAHVLIYAISLASLQYIESCAPVPYVQACCLSSWNWSKLHKKRTFTTSIHVCF